jgi:hypothetical protein
LGHSGDNPRMMMRAVHRLGRAEEEDEEEE